MIAFIVVGSVFLFVVLGIAARVLYQCVTGQWRTLAPWKWWWHWGYPAWCWLWGCRERRYPVRRYRTLAELGDALRGVKYAKDKPWADYSRHPEAAQYLLDCGRSPGDCDDWHRYTAAAIAQVPGYGPSYLVIFKGHATCVYRHDSTTSQYGLCWWVMDYGRQIGPFSGVPAAVQAMCHEYWDERATWYVALEPDTLRPAALVPRC